MVLLNEYPFSILKAKADVIEGPLLEYASKYRAYVYISRGFLIFVLATVFTTLFLGMPPNIMANSRAAVAPPAPDPTTIAFIFFAPYPKLLLNFF